MRIGIDNIMDQLKADEGLRLKAYKDSLGFWTIGYGHKLEIVPGVENLVWTKPMAEDQLKADVDVAVQHLFKALPWVDDIDVVRRGVLENMTFNMGIGRLFDFHVTLNYVKGGDYVGASGEMLKSKWAVQVGARAVRLAEQMRIGVWQ